MHERELEAFKEVGAPNGNPAKFFSGSCEVLVGDVANLKLDEIQDASLIPTSLVSESKLKCLGNIPNHRCDDWLSLAEFLDYRAYNFAGCVSLYGWYGSSGRLCFDQECAEEGKKYNYGLFQFCAIAMALSSFFRTLPVGFRGKESRKVYLRGRL